MQEIPLLAGVDTDEITAFDPKALKDAEIDAVTLLAALQRSFAPFASLVANGCGFALMRDGAEVSITGISPKE